MKINCCFNFTIFIRSAVGTLIFISLLGCSSIFYQPSEMVFVDVQRLKVKPENKTFTTKNGRQLHAWYFKSSVNPPKGILVHFHGNAQNLTSHFFFLYQAPLRGYDHFIFDYEGYGQSEGEPTPKNVVDDGEAALHFARTLRSDSVPLIIFGQSLGGNIALRLLADASLGTRTLPSVQLAILDSTFPSYRTAARQIVSRIWWTWILQPLAWLIVDNSQGVSKSDVKRISPTPLWVIHGTADQVIDFSQGERIYQWAEKPKFWLAVPGGRHTSLLSTPAGNDQFFAELERLMTPPAAAKK